MFPLSVCHATRSYHPLRKVRVNGGQVCDITALRAETEDEIGSSQRIRDSETVPMEIWESKTKSTPYIQYLYRVFCSVLFHLFTQRLKLLLFFPTFIFLREILLRANALTTLTVVQAAQLPWV